MTDREREQEQTERQKLLFRHLTTLMVLTFPILNLIPIIRQCSGGLY